MDQINVYFQNSHLEFSWGQTNEITYELVKVIMLLGSHILPVDAV